ncbi:hypothetical protein [Paenibacillus polymyxa]|uniref:hypothetical protein n=1 Tax=Paenibacillus polymyxa TaxID=1406 RepID=UPI000496B63F|nr:hypothetical protein [Paenibacillus polymyxa]
MQAIKRFGELKLEQFMQGVNNNWLIFSPLPHSKQHSSGLDDSIIISATPTVEIIDADLDVKIDPQYVYTYSIATDNKLKIAFDKSTHLDKGSALDTLKYISITYELGNLVPNGNYYRVVVRNSLGEEVHRTNPLLLDQVDKVISTLDDTRDVSTSGYVRYEIERDYIVN